MDESDAFQSTPANAEGMPDMYYMQAKGFEEFGPNGEKMVCKRVMAHQGSIDASAIFSAKKDEIYLAVRGNSARLNFSQVPFSESPFFCDSSGLRGDTCGGSRGGRDTCWPDVARCCFHPQAYHSELQALVSRAIRLSTRCRRLSARIVPVDG